MFKFTESFCFVRHSSSFPNISSCRSIFSWSLLKSSCRCISSCFKSSCRYFSCCFKSSCRFLVVLGIPTYNLKVIHCISLNVTVCVVRCKFESSILCQQLLLFLFILLRIRNLRILRRQLLFCFLGFFFCCEYEIFESLIANCCIVVRKRYKVK